MTVIQKVLKIVKTELWLTVIVLVMVSMVMNVTSLSGSNVCMVKQKYNITKRVKYRAPMSVRTYEWCFSIPPRCSRWNTEMRDVTRLETEERTAEMAVCCPGFKLRDVSCVPNCPSGKTGQGCSEDCPPNKWGPSCTHDCKKCEQGSCDATTGVCRCQDGWQGESCETSMTTTAATMMEQLLTTELTTTQITTQTTPTTKTSSSTVTTQATKASSASNSTNSMTPRLSSRTSSSTEVIQTVILSKATTIATTPFTKEIEKATNIFSTPKTTVTFSNVTISTIPLSTYNTYEIKTEDVIRDSTEGRVLSTEDVTKEMTRTTVNNSNYNRTEKPTKTVKIESSVKTAITTEPNVNLNVEKMPFPTIKQKQSQSEISSTAMTTTATMKPETKKTLTTIRQPMTTKLKPKEIWIKPAQKGESIVETKIKAHLDLPHSKFKNREVVEVTTPKTIIVSIIPTSVTYATFKKIALTSASPKASMNYISSGNTNTKATEQELTKSMLDSTTSMPLTVKNVANKQKELSEINPFPHLNVTKTKSYTSTTRKTYNKAIPTKQTTNSMISTLNEANKSLNSSFLTTVSLLSTNITKLSRTEQFLSELTTRQTFVSALSKNKLLPVPETTTTRYATTQKQSVTVMEKNFTSRLTDTTGVTKYLVKKQVENKSNKNITNSNTTTNTVTDKPSEDEETFHILTEPEHITAVMGDKGNDRSTINLISVLSIAGGVMMAVITVAVVIVMLERCRKPRYEDVRKYNDIRMQVMIDNNDVPPPYVRSIFHTPLPEPPTSEKCHYQPISTLDRNLKQFMRPVVVQTISPLMLENFRGILECHYDHLPRRSQDMGTLQTRCSVAPSIDEHEELLPTPRIHSLTDSDIEAMKCEAKLDVIDNTTSEPLYAEIPCWRPPSAHAIEIVNLNGEAVTEL